MNRQKGGALETETPCPLGQPILQAGHKRR